jgi:hypothetical protein
MSSVHLRRAKMKHSHQKKVARTFDVRTRECIRTLHLQYLNERDSFYVYITNA